MYFEKVSFEQYETEALRLGFTKEEILAQYKQIKLPERSSKFSAGYDFFLPFEFKFNSNTTYKIPTGIRWVVKGSSLYTQPVLLLVPRSGLGCKYGLRLRNTVGVIDADYCLSSNEGHIMVFIESDKGFVLDQNKGFIQGIITNFTTVENDNANKTRNGGFGSSGV